MGFQRKNVLALLGTITFLFSHNTQTSLAYNDDEALAMGYGPTATDTTETTDSATTTDLSGASRDFGVATPLMGSIEKSTNQLEEERRNSADFSCDTPELAGHTLGPNPACNSSVANPFAATSEAPFDPNLCDTEFNTYMPEKCSAEFARRNEESQKIAAAGSTQAQGDQSAATTTPASEESAIKVKAPGRISDTLDAGVEGERFTIERNRLMGIYYQGPTDMTDEERAKAEAKVAELRAVDQAEKDRKLLGDSAPEIKVQKQGFFSDTLDMGSEEGKHRFTIERNRMGIFYQGPPDMTDEERAQAEAMVERYRASARQGSRPAQTVRRDEPTQVAAPPASEGGRRPSGASMAFNPAFCEDEDYEPAKCKDHSEAMTRIFNRDARTGQRAPAAAEFNPAYCDDEGYEPEKCLAHARKLYPSTFASETTKPVVVVPEEPYNPANCGIEGYKYQDKCNEEAARRTAEVEARQKEERRKQQRAAAAAAEKRKIADAQDAAQKNQARYDRMKASRLAACEDLRKQGQSEFFERFAGKYEKMYRECLAKVEADFFNP